MSFVAAARALPAQARFGARTLAFAGYSIATYVAYTAVADPQGSEPDERRVRSTMRRYGRHMCRLFGVRLVSRGIPPVGYIAGVDSEGKGRVFVSNHRSGLDVLVTLATLEGRHVSRADLAGWPVIGRVARRAGILFVDRENRRSGARVMQEMIEQVNHGKGIVIFPEGTTFPGDIVREFNPGAFTVARRTGCEIVPVGLAYDGAGSAYEETDTFVEHMRRVSGRRVTRVAMAVGEPIVGGGVDSHELAKRAQETVQALVYDARKLL